MERIGQTHGVRRTLAGLMFGLAYACACLAISGFLLQRTAFDPDNSGSTAGVVLGDGELKKELVNFIVDNTAGTLTTDVQQIEQLRATVTLVAGHPDGEKFLAKLVHDAHAHMIGDSDAPVQITGEELVPIVRNEAAATIPTLTLPVPRIGPLALLNHVLDWLLPIAAIATLVLVLVGLTAHPDKEAVVKSLAFALLLLAVLAAILGYVVPKLVIPMLNDSVWANLPGRIADDQLPLLIGLELLLIGAALALLAGSGMMRRRRRWSQPISTYRYTEQRNWS